MTFLPRWLRRSSTKSRTRFGTKPWCEALEPLLTTNLLVNPLLPVALDPVRLSIANGSATTAGPGQVALRDTEGTFRHDVGGTTPELVRPKVAESSGQGTGAGTVQPETKQGHEPIRAVSLSADFSGRLDLAPRGWDFSQELAAIFGGLDGESAGDHDRESVGGGSADASPIGGGQVASGGNAALGTTGGDSRFPDPAIGSLPRTGNGLPGGGRVHPDVPPHGAGGNSQQQVTFGWTNTLDTSVSVTNPGNQTSAEGASASLQIQGSDSLGYTLTYDAVSLPSGLSINNSTGLISGTVAYTAAEAFGGSYSVTAIAADGHGGSASQTFTWTITAADETPVLTNPGNQTSAQGDTVSLQLSASSPKGNSLGYSAMGLPNGLFINEDTGLISGTISTGTASPTPYSVTATAGDGTLSANQTFSWSVTAAARTPQVTSPGNQSNALGDTVSLPITASDSDGNTLTYTATGLPLGLAIDPGTGIVSGTVSSSANTSTPYSTTITASDGALSASQAMLWSISYMGVVNPGNQTNTRGDIVSLQINVDDSSGDTVTYSASGLPSGVSINTSTGLISGTISTSADSGSPYSSSVTAYDGSNSASQSFTWTVVHTSLASPGNQTNQEGNTVSLQLAGDDPGGTLTYTAAGLPSGLTLGSSTGLISGTVAAATHGSSPYTVTVTATDGSHSASQTLIWTVTPHVVILQPGPQFDADLDSVSLPIKASDSDNGTLSYSATGLPSGLTINSSTGLISGTVSGSDDGSSPYSTKVTVTDGSYSDSQTFSWTVSYVLLLNPGTENNYDSDAVTVSPTARDNRNDTITYSAIGLPNGLSISSSTGVISGTIASTADGSSPYQVSWTASDGSHSNTQQFTWSVSQAIYFQSPGNQANADGDSVSVQEAGGDSVSGTLTYSASGLPSGLSINSSTGLISGTIGSNADGSSPYPVTVTATDGTHTGTDSFSWVVGYLGVTNPGAQTSSDGQTVSLAIQGNDVHHDTLTYSATGLPSGLAINSATGVILGTVSTTAHTNSAYLATVTASNGTQSASQAFTWTVNRIGVVAIANHTNTEGDTVSLQLSASVPSGTLTYSSSTLPAGLTLNSSTGLISGTVAAGAALKSPYSITVSATDGTLASSQAFSWTVNPYVTITSVASQSNPEGATISLQVAATDAGAHALTYAAYGLPAGLSINPSSGLISGTISTGDANNSPYGVAVTAGDGTYSSAITFAWSVTHSNDSGPLLTNPGNQGNNDGDVVTLQLTATDPDNDPLSFTATGLPAGLYLNGQSGLVLGTLTSKAVTAGPAAVTITVNNGNGQSASQAFTWMVNPANLTGQANSLSATEGAPENLQTVATFSDPDEAVSASDFTASINWGDGTPPCSGYIAGAAGAYSVTGDHLYNSPGTFTTTVTIADSEGAALSLSGTASVASASLSSAGLALNGVVGTSTTFTIASFIDGDEVDSAGTYSATIHWGDGNSSTGTITGARGSFLVSGIHSYQASGSYTATTTITDKDGTSTTASGAVTVGNVSAGAMAGLTAVPFTGVSGGTPANSSATITWGDGTQSSGTVTGSLGDLTVTGNHHYAASGTYSFSVVVTSTSGGSQSANGSVLVDRGALAVFGDAIVSTPGSQFANVPVATFVDANANDMASTFLTTITWGDGSTASGGSITTIGSLFEILGTHTYSCLGAYEINVSLSPSSGAPALLASGLAKDPAPWKPGIGGPLAVPGNSQYVYTVVLPPNTPVGALSGVLWTISDPEAVYDQGGGDLEVNGNVLGFFHQYFFLNLPNQLTLSVTFSLNGKQFNTSTQIDVVQVIVRPPVNAQGQELPPFQLGAAQYNGVTYIPNCGSPQFTIGGVPQVTVNAMRLYPKAGNGDPRAIQWQALITLVGPDSAISAISVGFAQFAQVTAYQVALANGGDLVSSMEGNLFFDPGPYQPAATSQAGIPLNSGPLKGTSGTLFGSDGPTFLFPVTYRNVNATSVAINAQFTDYVGATTADDTLSAAWEEASASPWTVNLSGTIGMNNGVMTWTPNAGVKQITLPNPNAWAIFYGPPGVQLQTPRLPQFNAVANQEIWTYRR
jgi:hypothetical protein